MTGRVKVDSGDRYGRLVVLRECDSVMSGGRSVRRVECICDCGVVKEYWLYSLRNGNTSSCGCFAKEVAGKGVSTHGLSGSAEYRIWQGMIARCKSLSKGGHKDYGGRGIKVCERWANSFEAFYSDMGPRPSAGHSIDRYPDNDGNYEPSNCRWATQKEQCRNRRVNYIVTHNGQSKCVSEWAEEYGFKASVLYERLVTLGWTFEKSVSWPVSDRSDVRSRHPHYRVPLRHRDSAWKREHARLEIIRIAKDIKKLKSTGSQLAKTHRVEESAFIASVESLLNEGWTWNGAVLQTLKELGAVK